MTEAFLGRQAIFDRHLHVFAYELLFRADEQSHTANISCGDAASVQVLTTTFKRLGIQKVVGNKKAFINVTRNLALGDTPFPLPKDQIVLEMLENQIYDEKLIAGLKKLKNEGYTIALDDFIYSPHLEELIQLADIIKLDVLALGVEGTQAHLEKLKPYGMQFLAEKIETHEMFMWCMDLGFDYFQGYFLCKPETLSSKKIAHSLTTTLTCLQKIIRPYTSPQHIDLLLSESPYIALRVLSLLQEINEPLLYPVHSMQDLAFMISLDQLKNLAIMIVLSQCHEQNKPVFKKALMRALLCQKIGMQLQLPYSEALLFGLGFLSMLPDFFSEPLESLLEQFELPAIIQEGLVKKDSTMHTYLRMIEAYERGDMPNSFITQLTEKELKQTMTDATYQTQAVVSALFDVPLTRLDENLL